MSNHPSFRGWTAILTAAFLAACAGSGGGPPGEAEPAGESISIQVTNDLTPPTGVNVWVVSQTGARRRIGFVSPNGRRSLSYAPTDLSQEIYLIAVPEGPTSGTMGATAERKSNTFSIVGVQSLSWSVSQANVRIGG